MNNLIFSYDKEILYLTNNHKNYKIPADCNVRNELNGRRSLNDPDDVVYTIPENSWEQGSPYMPRPFPRGHFFVLSAEQTSNEFLKPYILRTDAQPMVETWSLNNDGTYSKPTGKYVMDTGYLIHFTEGPTTLGCIRVKDIYDMEYLYEVVTKQLIKNKFLRFQVI